MASCFSLKADLPCSEIRRTRNSREVVFFFLHAIATMLDFDYGLGSGPKYLLIDEDR